MLIGGPEPERGRWHAGQRGSHVAITRAIARRKVMKLSAKCRSGREGERAVGQRPSGRGGETPHTFSDDERVAAKSDGDVMMPALEPPSLEVVQSKLAFEILVN